MGGSGALMRGMAKHINSHGLPVVTFDMRGAGKSSGRATWTGIAEVKDVVAVCSWVVETLQHEILLIGSSAGMTSIWSCILVIVGILVCLVNLCLLSLCWCCQAMQALTTTCPC